MSASTAQTIHKNASKTLDPVTAKFIEQTDYGGNQMIKQANQADQQSADMTTQQTADAATAGTQETKNADTRSAALRYSADSADATRTGNSADTLTGGTLMTPKKRQASRDLGVS